MWSYLIGAAVLVHHLSLHPPDPQWPQEKRQTLETRSPTQTTKQPSVSLSLTRCLTTFTSLVFAHDEGKIRSERLPQTGTEGGAQGLLKEQWAGLLTADQSDGSTEGRGMGAEPETRERGREEWPFGVRWGVESSHGLRERGIKGKPVKKSSGRRGPCKEKSLSVAHSCS